MTNTKRRRRAVLALLLAIAAAIAAYGFTATNSVPESGAGDGTGVISGYTVSAISYALNSADPSKIDSVSFNLAATAGAGTPTNVRAALSDGTTSTWSSACTGGSPWVCSFTTPPSVQPATQLRVIAAQ